MTTLRLSLALAAVAALVGCGAAPVATPPLATPSVAAPPSAPAESAREPVVVASPAPAALPPPLPTPEEPPSLSESVPPARVEVPGDKAVYVADAPPGVDGVIVYLHGVCGDALAFRAFERAALRFGSVVSLQGDDACDTPGRFRWGIDVKHQQRRIKQALDAVAARRGAPLDRSRVVLMGYSQGALRVEALGVAFPAEYPRLVAIAGPRAPHLDAFRRSQSIALVAGAWDIRSHLQEGAAKLVRRGIRAEYAELPRARHGQYGPDAERVLGDVLDWLYSAPAPPSP